MRLATALILGLWCAACGRANEAGGSTDRELPTLSAADACDEVVDVYEACNDPWDHSACVDFFVNCSRSERINWVQIHKCWLDAGCTDAAFEACAAEQGNVSLECNGGPVDRETMATRCEAYCDWEGGCHALMSCSGPLIDDCETDCAAGEWMDDLTWADLQSNGFPSCDQQNTMMCNSPEYSGTFQAACNCPTDTCYTTGEYCYPIESTLKVCVTDAFEIPAAAVECTTTCTAGYTCMPLDDGSSWCMRICSFYY